MKIVRRAASNSTARYLDETWHFTGEITPLFQIEDENAEVIARYEDGSVACARKDETIYSAVGPLPWKLWRDLAKTAGVHIYDENGGGSAVCSQFIASYTTLREDCELHPREDGWYREVFSGKLYECQNGSLRYSAPTGTTMLFIKNNP